MTATTATPARVLGRLADEQRLRVLSAVALGATTYAPLRRYLVDAGLLVRKAGVYRRGR